jgi:hypothetical protein
MKPKTHFTISLVAILIIVVLTLINNRQKNNIQQLPTIMPFSATTTTEVADTTALGSY